MADRVRKVGHFCRTAPTRTGSEPVLGAPKAAGVNLRAFQGFLAGAGRAQLDVVVESVADVRRVAARNRWRLSPTKKAFLVQGQDRPGACPGTPRGGGDPAMM